MPSAEDPNDIALVCMDEPSLGAGGAVIVVAAAALAGDIVGVGVYRLDGRIGFVLG